MNEPKTPSYPQITAAQVVPGSQAQQQGYSLAQQEYGPQMGAQAQGLADIAQGQGYYNNFGPSTLAQAVGNQYMANIWPQESAMISNQMANSGMGYSPSLASTLGNAYGTLGTNVGEYEQGISNQNATNNLSQLMSINPSSFVNPITSNIMQQSDVQGQLSQQANMQNAQASYANQMAKYNQQMQMNGMFGTIGGAGLGALAGSMVGNPLGGAAVGGSLGGAVMGGGSASSLGNSLMSYNYLGNMPGTGSTNNQSNSMFNTGINSSLNNSYSNVATSGYGNSSPIQGGNMFGMQPLSSAVSGY